MTYTIRLTPPDLRNRADVISNNAGTVAREVEAIAQIIDSLRPTFLGNRASNFFKEFDAARGDMEQWSKLVNSFAEELRAAANRLESADNQG